MLQRKPPLAEQLIQELAEQISMGKLFEPDGRLPSEAELAERYSVSRATVREALGKLELAGVVTRRHGAGTFVNPMIKNRPSLVLATLDEAPQFVDMIARAGHAADVRVLDVALVPAGELAARLAVPADEQVVSYHKLIYADRQPVIYTNMIVPCGLLGADCPPSLDLEDYRPSIYKLLQARSNRSVHHQESVVRAAVADKKLAGLLECARGHPLLQVEEFGYDAEQNPLFYGLHHFDGEHVHFRLVRRPTFTID